MKLFFKSCYLLATTISSCFLSTSGFAQCGAVQPIDPLEMIVNGDFEQRTGASGGNFFSTNNGNGNYPGICNTNNVLNWGGFSILGNTGQLTPQYFTRSSQDVNYKVPKTVVDPFTGGAKQLDV